MKSADWVEGQKWVNQIRKMEEEVRAMQTAIIDGTNMDAALTMQILVSDLNRVIKQLQISGRQAERVVEVLRVC